MKEKQLQKIEQEMAKSASMHKAKLDAIETDIKESGMDKDSYLAFLIDSYERKVIELEHTNQDLMGMSEALKMDAAQQIDDLTRRLKVYKAQIGSQSPMPDKKGLGKSGPIDAGVPSTPAKEKDTHIQKLEESHKREQFLEEQLKDAEEKMKLMAIALEGN